MQSGDNAGMWDTISAYGFCILFGVIGLALGVWLIVSGQFIHSVDDLFLVLVSLLFALVCFGYLGWRVQAALDAASGKKKKK